MSSWRFIAHSLTHHWRINLAVALGVAAATAVLTGALLVGDSVRGSLRQLTLERLGAIDEVLVSQRFFREQLADELAAADGFDQYFTSAQPAILFPGGTVERMEPDGKLTVKRAAGVLVVGTRPEFWELGSPADRPGTLPGDQEIVLNEPLADELDVQVGDLVALRLPDTNQVPAESLLGEKADRIRGITQLRVVNIVPARGLGRFGLQASQATPRNAYVSLATLQQPLDQEGRANCLLVAGKSAGGLAGGRADQQASDKLAEIFRPNMRDYGFQLKHVSVPGREEDEAGSPDTIADPVGNTDRPQPVTEYFSLSSDQMLFSPEAERVAEAAYGELGGQPVLTYLANAISKVQVALKPDTQPADRGQPSSDEDPPKEDRPEIVEIPYSTIAAINPLTAAELLRTADGTEIKLGDDDVVLNSWAAEYLNAKLEDTIRVTYFEPETTHGEYVETSVDFTLRGIVPLTEPKRPATRIRPAGYDEPPTLVNDPDLTPDVPGVTDSESIESWDVPFPMTRSIPTHDDTYWKNHRTTPKAFIALRRGQQLWGTDRFGDVTSYRVPMPDSDASPLEIRERLEKRFEEQARKQGARLGLVFQPMKLKALEASAGTTPFDGLFLGLSLFIIAAALMLVALLFRLGVEQRAAEIGLLLAVGFRRRRAARLFVFEGLIVSALGGVLGVIGGVAYSHLMLAGLQSWWVGAIATPFLQFHWRPLTLAIGYILGVLVSAATIAWTTRQLRRFSNRQLLAGQAHETGGLVPRPRPWTRLVVALLLVLTGGLATAALFVGGETQAGCFVGAGASLLTALLLMIWARLRGGGRGTVAVGRLVTLKLAARSAARNPGRSTLTIGLIAFASFLIVSMSSFRMAPTTGGVGGFNLLAQSGQPVFDDLGTEAGRRGLLGSRADELQGVTIMQLRLKPGDDASCNNLYRAAQPQVLGVSEAMVRYFDDPEVPHFAWAASAAETDEERRNPWRLLERPAEDDVIPVVLDKDTAMWSLRLYRGVGERFDVTYDDGVTLRFRVVGLLAKSVLQGKLLVGNAQFVRRFPDVAGHRFFLIRTPPERQQAVVTLLESRLSDEGFDAVSSYRILEGLLAVQNTYLLTFQSLGALGLLLGTFGLATVQLRSVMERRGELALLRTTGFRRRRLAAIVLLENALLLLAGLATGVLAALVAVLPHMLTGAASIPWRLLGELALMLGLILLVGLASGVVAVRATLKAPLLRALRRE